MLVPARRNRRDGGPPDDPSGTPRNMKPGRLRGGLAENAGTVPSSPRSSRPARLLLLQEQDERVLQFVRFEAEWPTAILEGDLALAVDQEEPAGQVTLPCFHRVVDRIDTHREAEAEQPPTPARSPCDGPEPEAFNPAVQSGARPVLDNNVSIVPDDLSDDDGGSHR